METDDLVTRLAADLRPVRPLASPLARASAMLAAVIAVGLVAIALSDITQFTTRHAGSETRIALEMSLTLVTGVLAVIGAFCLAVPGGSRLWLAAPLPPLAAWLLMAGANCPPVTDWRIGDSWHCLAFVTGTSLVLGIPLAWRLARARPIDPLGVALLGGLGSAALSAFLLSFFHPFAFTAVDLAVHVAAMLLVIGAAATMRRALHPA